MIDRFKQNIEDSICVFINRRFPEYKINSRHTKKSDRLVFSRRFTNGSMAFISLVFVKGRDYVIPSVQWSNKGNYPNENCLALDLLVSARKNFDIFKNYDDIWLTACEFGYQSSHIDIDQNAPSELRLKEIFEGVEANEIMQSVVGDGWRKNSAFHSWDMIDELLPNSITDEDAKNATSQAIEGLEILISKYFVPYANSLGDDKSS